MRIVISEFISLDGVVQAPGGANEDTDGGFRHGGWSMQFFDPEVMGAFTDAIGKFIALSEDAVRLAQPHAALDRKLIEEQAYAVTTFLNGVMVRLALGERTVESAAHLGELLHALVAGIASIRGASPDPS